MVVKLTQKMNSESQWLRCFWLERMRKPQNSHVRWNGINWFLGYVTMLPQLKRQYEGVSKSFRTEYKTKYMLTFDITCCCPLQRVMVAKLTKLSHKIVIQLHLVAKSCTICSFCSRWQVWKLVDTPPHIMLNELGTCSWTLSIYWFRRQQLWPVSDTIPVLVWRDWEK
jgi:hypothetical protein